MKRKWRELSVNKNRKSKQLWNLDCACVDGYICLSGLANQSYREAGVTVESICIMPNTLIWGLAHLLWVCLLCTWGLIHCACQPEFAIPQVAPLSWEFSAGGGMLSCKQPNLPYLEFHWDWQPPFIGIIIQEGSSATAASHTCSVTFSSHPLCLFCSRRPLQWAGQALPDRMHAEGGPLEGLSQWTLLWWGLSFHYNASVCPVSVLQDWPIHSSQLQDILVFILCTLTKYTLNFPGVSGIRY